MIELLNFQAGSEVQPGVFPFAVIETSTGRVIQSGTTMHTEGLVKAGQTLLDVRPPKPDSYWKDEWKSTGAAPSTNGVFDYSSETWHDPRTLSEVRAFQTGVINTAFESAAQALTAGYPPTERSTWFMQQSEALAWGANSTAPTPYLDGLATARGIEFDDMRRRTLGNVRLFMTASQQLIGKRQSIKSRIDQATTAEAIAEIVWE